MNEVVKRNPRRSPTQWQAIIEAQQQSGLSARVYCEQNGLGYASFCKWKQRLSSTPELPVGHSPAPQTDFIDLSGLPDAQPSAWQIVLKLGNGMELLLSKG